MAFNLQAAVDAAIAAAVADAGGEVSDLQATIAALNSQVSTLTINLAASQTTIDGMAHSIGDLEAALAACEAANEEEPPPPPPPPPANTPPNAVNNTASGTVNTTITGNVLTNDTDADGHTLTVTAHSGAFSIATNGSWSYTPTTTGTKVTNYTVSDGHGGTDTATVTVTVNAATTTPPPTTGWPDASNTGVKPGTTMTSQGSLIATTAGAVISGKIINGLVEIKANNVTMRNCKVVNNGATPYHVVRVFDGVNGFVMEDCEVDGGGADNAIAGWGTFRRLNIHDMDNGINTWGPCDIQDCWIHDFRGGSDAHFDGIECNGGGGHVIKHNNIINQHNQTAALMLNNYFSPVNNILVENNRLIGGGYVVYLDERFTGGAGDNSTIRFINNRIGGGYYGPWALYNSHPIRSGNVNDATGQPI